MTKRLRRRRIVVIIALVIGVAIFMTQTPDLWRAPVVQHEQEPMVPPDKTDNPDTALHVLSELPVKGRAPKTGYARSQFGNGWTSSEGCDTRNTILARDMIQTETNEKCQVTRGVLQDPYTGMKVDFLRGPETSQTVQIDHVVALSNAWQTGAQQLTEAQRITLANDPLNLLAVDGKANQQKGDGDAATWLPPYRAFRCQYVARQISVKKRYGLWVTPPEKDAMQGILRQCPEQLVRI